MQSPRRNYVWIVSLVLIALAAGVFWRVPHYFSGPEPLGADSSSHIVASSTLAQHLEEGSAGWWMPDINLGFPLAHYYQPLPHFATAVLALLLGGPEQAMLAYKVLVVLLLTLLPVSAYVGFRRLGLSQLAALCGAIALATMSAPRAYYGLTTRHYLLVGLFTLLWGAVLAPLALAEGVRFIQGRGRLALAAGSFGLLFLGHGLFGLGLIPVLAFTALFAPGAVGSPLLPRLFRLVALGGISGGLIAFWLLPQLTCADYFGGWFSGNEERIHGLGLMPLLKGWMRGRFTDFRSLPVIAVLSLLGTAALVVGSRRSSTQRILLFGVILFVIFTAGRQTFGPVLDWVFPPNTRIEGMMRYMALLHLFLAVAAGLGAELIYSLVTRSAVVARRSWLVAALVPIAFLGLTLPRHLGDLAWGLDTFLEVNDRPSYVAVAEALAAEEEPGRVYTRETIGHGTHWAMVYLSELTGKPMLLSYGVGGQDSLNFYYLALFDLLDRQRAAREAELYNIRYVLLRPNVDVRFLKTKRVAARGMYKAVRLPGEYGYFDLIGPPDVIDTGRPVLLRGTFERWVKRKYPRGEPFLRMRDPIHAKLPSLPASNLESRSQAPPVERSGPAGAGREARGEVLSESAAIAEYRARFLVEEEPAWALLKVTAHPFWTATVDGERSPVYYLSPAFMGLPLEAGEHTVVFTFRAPLWQLILLWGSPVLLVALVLADRGRLGSRLSRWLRTDEPEARQGSDVAHE